MKLILVFAAALAVCGCSITVPVAVVGTGLDGGVLKGTATAALSGGTFTATNGRLTCGGDYDALDSSPTITIPVQCNDGRTGIVIATRSNTGASGGGTFTLNDGSNGSFIFGDGANAVQVGQPHDAGPAPRSAPTVPLAASIRPATSQSAMSSRPQRTLSGPCPCGSGRVCIGPRGGRYCITSGGNKRYGR